tara:strand:- start:180 stop:392 length:213 start_codon:yes stop_codon:yes gene_type:complete
MSNITTNSIKAIFANKSIKVAYCAIQSMGRGRQMVTVRGYNATTGRDENVQAIVRYVPCDITELINNHNN